MVLLKITVIFLPHLRQPRRPNCRRRKSLVRLIECHCVRLHQPRRDFCLVFIAGRLKRTRIHLVINTLKFLECILLFAPFRRLAERPRRLAHLIQIALQIVAEHFAERLRLGLDKRQHIFFIQRQFFRADAAPQNPEPRVLVGFARQINPAGRRIERRRSGHCPERAFNQPLKQILRLVNTGLPHQIFRQQLLQNFRPRLTQRRPDHFPRNHLGCRPRLAGNLLRQRTEQPVNGKRRPARE